jgi:hypothetical protein
MIFESEKDTKLQKNAIQCFVNLFKGDFMRLSHTDVDYKVFDKDKNLIAYADIIVENKSLRDAYPLTIGVRKLLKLSDKRLNPVVIWYCTDGIIYGRVNQISGEIKWTNEELTAHYSNKKQFKYVRL